MAQRPPSCPFTTAVLDTATAEAADVLPAVYHIRRKGRRLTVVNPAENVAQFLDAELSLQELGGMTPHLWYAGAKRPASPLSHQVDQGREITVASRMDLHLLWDSKERLFLKPLPRFLLDVDFWNQHLTCRHAGPCRDDPPASASRCWQRSVALGFLYTYVCLVSSEDDFAIANEKRLLPRQVGGGDDTPIPWARWKAVVRELLASHDPGAVHPRFRRGELRLSRISTIHMLTRGDIWLRYPINRQNSYTRLFSDNIAWLSVATVYIALVLTAMQVGLATNRLQGNLAFQRASYGFTVFAILGPICALALVACKGLLRLVVDMPLLWRDKRLARKRSAEAA